MLLSFLACAQSPSGVWMFQLAVEPIDDDACAQSVSHNFEDAETPAEAEDENDWQESEDATWSEQIFFGLIEQTESGAVLFVGDEAWPGSGADGSWTFGWSTESWDERRVVHASGYQFEHTLEQSRLTELQGTFDGPTMTGEWHDQSEDYASYLESDVWSEEAADVIGDNGELPAGDHLVTEEWVKTKEGGKATEVAAQNTREGEECGGSTCTLSITDSCAWQLQLTGERTSLEPASFDSVSEAGQASGGA